MVMFFIDVELIIFINYCDTINGAKADAKWAALPNVNLCKK
jgi:hypothetical protein